MKTKLFTAFITLSILVSACSAPTHPADSQPATDSQTTSQPAQSPEATKPELPDPHSLEGLSVVADIADPQPISGDFKQQLPVSLTDVEGNAVTVSDTSRVLALDLPGTLSRTVIALGFGDKLVGRTVSSTEKQLASLPVVTEGGHTLNSEAVLNLQPTLIIVDRSIGPIEAIDQLRASGIPVVLVDSQRGLAHNEQLITQVAAALGVPEAGKALVARTQAETEAALAQIKEWVPAQPLEASFLYVRGTGGVFFILGASEGATELITAVGAKDMATANGLKGITPANAEALVKLNPEVIFTMSAGLESTDGLPGLLARPGVVQTRAGQKQRVVAIPDGLSLSFGPQTGETLLAVARALYGVDETK